MMREQHFALEREPQVLLRHATASKSALKEKFVQVYEAFFVGEDPSLGKDAFWDEVFLLKVNTVFLSQCFQVTNEEQLLVLKDNINKMFMQCLYYSSDGNAVRARNAMETLCAITRGVCTKKFNNGGYDIINLLVGVEQADRAFKDLMNNLSDVLLSANQPLLLKQSALRVLGVLLTCFDNLNSNTIVELLMNHDVFRSLVHVVCDPTTVPLALDACILITLFANFKKYESQNPYVAHLGNIKNTTVIETFVATLDLELDRCFGLLQQRPGATNSNQSDASTPSLINMLFSMWSEATPTNPTTPAGGDQRQQQQRQQHLLENDQSGKLAATFLALFNLLQSSRHFMRVVVKPLPVRRGSSIRSGNANTVTIVDNEHDPDHQGEQHLNAPLLSTFLTMMSMLAQLPQKTADVVDLLTLGCFTLQCLVEEPDTATVLFDRKRLYAVPLVLRRVRKVPNDPSPRPFATYIYDTMLILIWTSLRKPLPADLLIAIIGVVHRQIAYQCRSRIRLTYNWPPMFEAVFALLEKINQQLLDNTALLPVCAAATRLVHLMLLQGDVFINLAVSLDQLIYNLLRNEVSLVSLRTNGIIAACADAGDLTDPIAPVTSIAANQPSAQSAALIGDLEQLLLAQRYFHEQLEAAKILTGNRTPTVDGILHIIRDKMDGLQLRDVDAVSYERFNESTHTKFFRVLLRSIVATYRESSLLAPMTTP